MFSKSLVTDIFKHFKFFSCFCAKKCLEKIFNDVLDRKKTSFLDYKNINFTWLPNLMFSKGFVHDVLKLFISF